MAPVSPKLKFYNGNEIPIFGLGTWKSKAGEVKAAVEDAIDAGYRHIDGAHIYGNEKEVGEAVNNKIKQGVIKREDIFITSKLWNTFHRPDLVEKSFKTSLTDLGLDYVDLYLIHWPMAYKEEGDLFPTVDGKVQFSDVDYLDTWREMEKLYEKGWAKNIGVSNFNSKQLTRLIENCKIKPVTNQVECHAYLTQEKLSKFCKERDILITAYSPLGSPDRPWAKPDDPLLMEDPKIKDLSQKYNKTPAQILLRYQVDRGHIVIPKSVNKSRIIQNFDIFDFKLSDEDVALINTFDCNGRICPNDVSAGHIYHPFENVEF